jgi:tRNA pseudouridine55 synthase
MPSELSGIVVVDKPEGITSAGAVARVKEIYEAGKVGHTGTLDPFATGLLVCCLNRATRLARFLLSGDKTYEAEWILGVVTDTQDATGSVVERHSLAGIDENRIRKVATRFIGPITQVPPAYSALKHKGIPLYKWARRGKPVEKPARQVRIIDLQILSVHLPTVRLSVSCSSGTYIRTLCADMGRELGCGGHVRGLRRTVSCGFTIDDAWQLERLAEHRKTGDLEKTVIPMNEALPFLPEVVAGEIMASKIKHGMQLTDIDFSGRPWASEEGLIKVVDRNGRLLAVIGESAEPGRYNYCCVFSA